MRDGSGSCSKQGAQGRLRFVQAARPGSTRSASTRRAWRTNHSFAMTVQRDQIALVQRRHVATGDAREVPVGDLVDPARRAVDAVVVVALAGIAPVEHEHAAVGAVAQVDAAKPGVGGEEDVGLVAPDVAAARAFEPLDVDAPAVEVQGEAACPGRPPATGRPGRSSRRYGHGRRRGGRRSLPGTKNFL